VRIYGRNALWADEKRQAHYQGCNRQGQPPPVFHRPILSWVTTETTQYSVAFTSVFRPNLLNEVRIGVFRPRTIVLTPEDAKPELLPATAGGVPYILSFAGITSPFPSALGGASYRITPVYQ
jgi:hypothetical protein